MNKFFIKRVEIENFRSIEKEVDLDIKEGLYTIEGVNVDESARNGAGKSSIFSAIYWCITGTPLTNETLADEIINEKSGKNCRVTLFIESENGTIKITRTRKHTEYGNNLFLEVNGQDLSCHKIADTQDRLNQIIKIPFDLLHSTIMLTHDIKSAFSELSPQQRIHTLESIRDYSIWDKVRDEANSRIKDYTKKINEISLAISGCEGSLSTYQKINTDIIASAENLSKSFNSDAIKAEISKNKAEKEELSTQVASVSKQLESERANVVVDNTENQKKLDEIVDSANKIKFENQKLGFELEKIDQEIKIIEKWLVDDKCPTCGKPLDRSEAEINAKTKQKQDFIDQKTQINTMIAKNTTKLNEKRTDWAELNKKVKEAAVKIEVAQAKIRELEQLVSNLNNSLILNEKNTVSLEAELNSHDDKMLKFKENLEKNNAEIDKIRQNIETYTTQINELKHKRELSDYYYKLLGSKGELRPYLLSKDIKALNSYMQKYIHSFFKNTEIQLKLNGAAINIEIDSLGIKKSVSRLSGGEKKRLDIAIQFALYDLLQSTSQIKFNLVCFDEIESELDEAGISQIIDLVEDKSAEIPSVYWITNNPIVSENVPNKIICKKALGSTTIEEA